MPLARQTISALIVLLAIITPSAASRAGTGSAVSGSAAIDVRPPVLAVADVPDNTVLWAGEPITFSWTMFDDNSDTTLGATTAEIWLGALQLETHPLSITPGQQVWSWTAADTSSATAHLVVRSTDAFGNTTIAAGNDFTILSATTDVPEAYGNDLFALPAPNPFNPQTELRFNLPAAGSVQVTVHDARGYRIRTLLNSHRTDGPLVLRWDGTDTSGRRQAGGTYFFRLVYQTAASSQSLVRKAVLLP